MTHGAPAFQPCTLLIVLAKNLGPTQIHLQVPGPQGKLDLCVLSLTGPVIKETLLGFKY